MYSNTVRKPSNAVAASKVAYNVLETKDAFVLQLRVPGAQKELLKLEVQENVLSISYNPPKEEREGLKVIRKEFESGTFEKKFTLSDTIDIDAILSEYQLGILSINLPKIKIKEPQSKLITIS